MWRPMERPVYMSPVVYPKMKIDFKEFGTRLAAVLEDKGISDLACSEEIGVDDSTIGRYKAGKGNPTFKKLIKLINFLQVDPQWFLFGVRPKEPLWFLDYEQVERNPNAAAEASRAMMKSMLDAFNFAHDLETK